MSKRDEFTQPAEAVPFDPDNCLLITEEDVQNAMEELCAQVEELTITSSPGFTWGDSGSIKNSYILNDTVASNIAGRIVPVTGFITTIFFANAADDKTFNIEIRRRNEPAGTYTTIATLTVVNQRKKVDTTFNVAVSFGDELACYVAGAGVNAAQNPVVGLIIKGT